MRYLVNYLKVLACFCLLLGIGWAAGDTRTVMDARGVEVQIPADIERVVTISQGFVESVMFVLGEEDKIVGIYSPVGVNNFNFTDISGKTHEYRGGMRVVDCLCPQFKDLTTIGQSSGVNYETVAKLHPDLVIMRVGEAAFQTMNEKAEKTIKTIESLGIPIVVLKATTCFDKPDISQISDEIKIIGNVFGKEEKAEKLADYLESRAKLVTDRTKDIPDSEKPKVLIFLPSSTPSASATSEKTGGTGTIRGISRIESYFIEEIVHAKNAFQETGSPTISAEQLLALDPDVLLLYSASMGYGSYHPPEELYTSPDYKNLQDLSAIKNHRVSALPYQPCPCARRLEYPNDIMVIAKVAYPERFEDIDLGEYLLDHYETVYGVDQTTAEKLRSAQLMDWCVTK